MNKEKISKMICYWLRHNPQAAGLTVDEFGWANIDDLLKFIQKLGFLINLDFIQKLNLSTDKIRWEIDITNNRIRATHGHSFPVIVGDTKIPPDILYHGTAIKYLPSILENGLLPQGRQFVHLASDIETAIVVGKRHGDPFVFKVDTNKMVQAGYVFYNTSDGVWLTKIMPVEFLDTEFWNDKLMSEGHGKAYTLSRGIKASKTL